MVAIPKIVEGCLCGVMLVLGSFQAAHVYAETPAGPEINSTQFEPINLAIQAPKQERLRGVQPRQDDVLLVEGRNDFVTDLTGKEPRLILDPGTQKIVTIQLGDRIERKDLLGSTTGGRVREVGPTGAWWISVHIP